MPKTFYIIYKFKNNIDKSINYTWDIVESNDYAHYLSLKKTLEGTNTILKEKVFTDEKKFDFHWIIRRED